MEYFDSLEPLLRYFWYVAIPVSVIFLIQVVLTFFSGADIGDLETDFDTNGHDGFHFFSFRNLINFLLGFSWAGISFYQTISNPIGLLVFALIIWSLISYGQIIQFADPNFKNALVNTNCVDINNDEKGDEDADTNDDGEIEISEAEIITSLYVDNKSISNLSGIEFFTALQVLDCSFNKLSLFEVYNFPSLLKLDCSHNLLTALEVSNLSALQELDCNFMQLSSLVVSNLPALEKLSCFSTQLTTLDVSKLTALKELSCYYSQL